jgi:hypothetical protein
LISRAADLVAAVSAWVTESVAAGEPARLIEQHLKEFLGS